MDKAVFISICIPAYKNVSFLKRLLDSIQIQSYRHFEVVLTDDSPDNEVFELCRVHGIASSIRYFKNEKPLGTPENWNESLRQAKGEWIKLMHDDDWFAGPHALEIFSNAPALYPGKVFFFSAYRNVFLDDNSSQEVMISRRRLEILKKNPKTLLSRNSIGPPSVTFHKQIPGIGYDPALKWLVDIDFYMSFLNRESPVLIPENLINVGISAEQVTRHVFRKPMIEIPENLYVLDKIGIASLKNMIVYDAFWRFIRNLNVRSVENIRGAGYTKPIPEVIQSMIRFQSFIPELILKNGLFSKILMSIHYIFQFPKLSRG